MTDNGERLENLCIFNDLVTEGSEFPHKNVQKASWVLPDDFTENQTDYICIKRSFHPISRDV